MLFITLLYFWLLNDSEHQTINSPEESTNTKLAMESRSSVIFHKSSERGAERKGSSTRQQVYLHFNEFSKLLRLNKFRASVGEKLFTFQSPAEDLARAWHGISFRTESVMSFLLKPFHEVVNFPSISKSPKCFQHFLASSKLRKSFIESSIRKWSILSHKTIW